MHRNPTVIKEMLLDFDLLLMPWWLFALKYPFSGWAWGIALSSHPSSLVKTSLFLVSCLGEAQETISSQQSEWRCQPGISLYIDCNCFSLLMRLSSHPSLFFPISGRFQLHKVIALRQPQLGFIVPAGQWVRHTSQLLFLRNKWPFRALIYGLPSQTLP